MTRKPPYFIILCEGRTDKLFFKSLFSDLDMNFSKMYVPLKGVTEALAAEVCNRVKAICTERKAKLSKKTLYLIIVHDRDNFRNVPGRLDPKTMNKLIAQYDLDIKEWHETLATVDLEGWFFYDLNGLYEYLNVPVAKRKKIHTDPDRMSFADLQSLFKSWGEYYEKGDKAQPIIDKLDLTRISENCEDLKSCLNFITNNQ